MRPTCLEAVRVFIAAATLSVVCGELTAAGGVPAIIVAQVDGGAAEPAPAKSGEASPMPEEQKHKVKSAVLMLSILSGIALSGLLLIIVAIAVRGLQRKLAGPTRLDRRPQDVLPDAVGHAEKETGAAGQIEGSDQASEETLFT